MTRTICKPVHCALLTIIICQLAGCHSEPIAAPDLPTNLEPATPREPPPTLHVSLDGKTISPRLEFIGSQTQSASYLLHVGIALALGSERDLNLSWEGADHEKLYLQTANQSPRLIGVRVKTTYRDEKEAVVNPLASLDPDELKGLRGVFLDHWSTDIAAKLALLDFNHVCLTISDGAAIGNQRSLPPLPKGIKILRIDSHSKPGLSNVDSLPQLPNLSALSVNLMSNSSLDCSLWRNSRNLKYLDLSGEQLQNPAGLSTYPSLQVLNLLYCRELTDISFVKKMPTLEELNLSHTKVTDLSPLTGLPSLRMVTANMTPVRKLPSTTPSLKKLDIVSSKVKEADVTTFRKANPDCQVSYRWTETLTTALESVNRLRVRSGGTCHRDETSEQTLFETSDAEQIKQLLTGIEVLEDRSGFHCMCCGDPSLEFYSGDKLLATLGFHHGQGLRWVGGWPGDAALSPQSASFLVDWLAARNVGGPSNDREKLANQEQATQRKISQATAGLSPSLAKAFAAGPQAFNAALTREIPDKKAQIKLWLQILGTSNDSWSQSDSIDHAAEEALKSYDQKNLQSAVENALAGQDRQLKRGAARLWMSWQSPLEEWQPENIAQLHRIVIQVQQEAQYYPLRMEALQNLASWHQEFTPDNLALSLENGLTDPAPQVRRRGMLVAGRIKHQSSVPVLLAVLQGESVTTHSLADVSTWEKTDVPEGFGDVAEGRSDREVAALALALMNHGPAKTVIEQALEPTPMKEVALALLGDGHRLQAEHFKTETNNQELQLAATEAVIRSKGKFGLDLAMGYQQATHWWEEEHVAKQLSQMLLAENAPGQRELKQSDSIEKLREWFNKYGQQYLARFREN